MRTIDNQWGNLSQGYAEATRLEKRLKQEWEEGLRKAKLVRIEKELSDWEIRKHRFESKNTRFQKKYIQELARWNAQLEEYSSALDQWRNQQDQIRNEQARFSLRLLLGGISSLLFIVSLLGIPVAIRIINSLRRQKNSLALLRNQVSPQPRPPRKPQPFDYESKLGVRPSLENIPSVPLSVHDLWWKGLSIRDNPDRGYGMEGVTQLLEKLSIALPDQYFAFQELLVTQHLDVDVMVIGPSGVWLLESKFWAGQVVCHKGTWYQVKDVYLQRRKPEKKLTTFNIHPDDQWLREKSMVAETLRRRLPEYPWILKHLHGGLAFTHPEVQLDIDRTCKVQWGKPEDWMSIIANSKPVPQLTEEVQLKVAEVILLFASIVDSSQPRKSAVALSQQLYSSAVKDAKAYVYKWRQ